MRKVVLISVGCLLLLLVLAIGAMRIGLQQLNDPESGASANFTTAFVDKCIAASQHDGQSTQSGAAGDDMSELCHCGADDMRQDLADGGLDGLAHLILIEGLDARIQRVMDGCQTTPSAP